MCREVLFDCVGFVSIYTVSFTVIYLLIQGFTPVIVFILVLLMMLHLRYNTLMDVKEIELELEYSLSWINYVMILVYISIFDYFVGIGGGKNYEDLRIQQFAAFVLTATLDVFMHICVSLPSHKD